MLTLNGDTDAVDVIEWALLPHDVADRANTAAEAAALAEKREKAKAAAAAAGEGDSDGNSDAVTAPDSRQARASARTSRRSSVRTSRSSRAADDEEMAAAASLASLETPKDSEAVGKKAGDKRTSRNSNAATWLSQVGWSQSKEESVDRGRVEPV